MNHPHRTPFPRFNPLSARRSVPTLTLTLLVALGPVLASPDAALAQRRGAGLKNDLKTARDAKPRQAEIEKFVAAQVKGLQNVKSPADQQNARDLLGRESMAVGGAASPSYQQVYATVVNKQLKDLAKSPNPRVRLNAAIALYRVALNTKSPALAEAATSYAADPCAGAALWAAKASLHILTPLAATGKRHKLGGAIVEGVVKHPGQPALVEEAYRALTLDFRAKPQNLTSAAVPALLPDVLRLVEARVKRYVEATPSAPGVDEEGAIFLTSGRVWNHPGTAKQHAAIIQQLTNLASLAAQHAAGRDETAARARYTDLMRQVGDALSVAATSLKDEKLQAATKALTESSPQMENEELSDRAEAVFDLFSARFKGLKPAPMIEPDAVNDDAEPVDEPPAEAQPAAGARRGAGDADESADEEMADEAADEE